MNFAFLLSALIQLFSGSLSGDASQGKIAPPPDTSGVITGARVRAMDTSGVLTGAKMGPPASPGVAPRRQPSRGRAMDTSGVITG